MNKMKKFFTLDRHHAEGFTLVELIVVIAILAILGGVAVPAYSGYITKTNKTADQTLVSEVANALSLYYYDNLDTQVAYVILAPEGADLSGIEVADEAGIAAMKAVFGEGWQDTAVLKTTGWDTNGVVNAALAQAEEAGDIVPNSSYMTGSSTQELLGEVSKVTNAAAGVMAGMTPTVVYDTICGNLFGVDEAAEAEMEKMCAQFGVKTDNGTIVEGQDTQLANMLVFAAAQQISEGSGNSFTGVVENYASCVAFANAYPNDPDVQEAYAKMSGGNLSAMEEIMKSEKYGEYMGAKGLDDIGAFVCIMDAVNQASGSITPEDIKDGNLFASNKIANAFDAYVAAAEAFSNMTPDQRDALQTAIDKAKSVGGVAVLLFSGPTVGCTSMEALLQ